jgi:O-antigen/teichoic acid export membrane protein
MEQNGKAYSILIIINKLIFITWVLGLVFFTDIDDLVILCSGTTIAEVAITIVAVCLGKGVWSLSAKKPKESEIDVKALVRYGFPFIYTLLATDIFHAADKWAINAINGPYEVGIYSAAASIVALCSVFKTTFDLVWAPLAMKHYETDHNEKSFYVKANGCITVVMMLIAIAIIAFKDIIAFLLGEKYRLASSIVPFLLFNPVMTTISETTVYGINFKKKTGYHIIITTVACIVNIILNSLLVPRYQSQGAALATAISYIVYYTMRTIMANRCFPVKFEHVKFIIAAICLFILSWINTFFRINKYVNIAICIGLAVVVMLLYKKNLKQIRMILKEIIRHKLLKSNNQA